MKTRDILTGLTLGVAITAALVLSGCVTHSDLVQTELRLGMRIQNNATAIKELTSDVEDIILELGEKDIEEDTRKLIEEVEQSEDVELVPIDKEKQ